MDIQRTLASRYQLVGHLARGGMADVFEADDRLLNRRVAVKVLHGQFASDQAFVARFRREAQASANLSHPNIVSIYDWGYDAGTYFMVMELIKGRTLRDILRTEGALLPRRAAEIAAEVAAALAVAHRAGISHRDVKPGNVMLTQDGSVKVTDFGIARALDDSEELTKTGAVIGTATYFSPEQAQGIPADGRSDLYSLGVVLYELLLGRPPFAGESPVAVAYQHVSEYPPAPRAIDPEVPPALEEIVLRALEKDPRDRYQTADDMRADLERFLRGERPAAAAVPLPAVVSPDAATEVMPAPPAALPEEAPLVYVGEEERQPVQYGFVAGVVALVGLLIVGIWLLFQLLSSGPSVTTVAVPDVAGAELNEAVAILQEAGLRVTTTPQSDAVVPVGLVIGTDPPAGTEVEVDAFVAVLISTGPDTVTVPAVIGEAAAVAEQLITNAGLQPATTFAFSPDVAEGLVISQDPEAGADVAPGSTVTIVVSTGPEAVTMPDLAGLPERTAIFQLGQAGFAEDQVIVVDELSAEVEEGTVIRTEPPAGSPVAPEATITLYVSEGLPAVPNLIGLTVEEARAALAEVELQLDLDTNTVVVSIESGLDGRIASQDPDAGALVEPGTAVLVQLGQLLRVSVPDLSGLTEAEARAALEAVDLVYELAGNVTVDLPLVGLVVSQDPAAGTQVVENSVVRVEIGVVRIVVVPDLSGLDETAARTALEDLGLVLEVIGLVVDDQNVGLVVSQDPAAETEVEQGSTVRVELGKESPPTTTSSTTTTTTP